MPVSSDSRCFRYLQAQKPADWIRHRSFVHRRACSGVVSQGIRLNKITLLPKPKSAAMHTLDIQQRYDSMLPPDNSFMEDAIEEKAAEIIERQGLEWLESRVDLKTWEKIVAACEAEAVEEIRAEIEDAEWEWRNHFN